MVGTNEEQYWHTAITTPGIGRPGKSSIHNIDKYILVDIQQIITKEIAIICRRESFFFDATVYDVIINFCQFVKYLDLGERQVASVATRDAIPVITQYMQCCPALDKIQNTGWYTLNMLSKSVYAYKNTPQEEITFDRVMHSIVTAYLTKQLPPVLGYQEIVGENSIRATFPKYHTYQKRVYSDRTTICDMWHCIKTFEIEIHTTKWLNSCTSVQNGNNAYVASTVV